MSSFDSLVIKATSNLEQLVENNISAIMAQIEEYCHSDVALFKQLYVRIRTDLKNNKTHRQEFPTATFAQVLEWITDRSSKDSVAASAEVRNLSLKGYTRKTNKGEETVKNDDYLVTNVVGFKASTYKEYKLVEQPVDIDLEVNVQSESEDEYKVDIGNENIWFGYIHSKYGHFNARGYLASGPSPQMIHNLQPHVEFEKLITLKEMDAYLKGFKSANCHINFAAFWIFPMNPHSTEFQKTFNAYTNRVGVAMAIARPATRDMFIVSVKKNEFAPSIFKVGDRDQFLELPRHDRTDRLLIIQVVFTAPPIIRSRKEYEELKVQFMANQASLK